MGGSRKSRPSFLQSLDLEVDLRADTEVATHDVRASPRRVETEQAVSRVGIERRFGVEQVEQVRIDGALVGDLQIGSESCRERGSQYVSLSAASVQVKKKKL